MGRNTRRLRILYEFAHDFSVGLRIFDFIARGLGLSIK